MMPSPWMTFYRGWLLCLMCATEREDQYLAIKPKRKTPRQVERWLATHRQCGFKGLS